MRSIRLLIADQHPIVLKGLMSVFAAQRDFEIVASCSSGTSCVEAIRNLAPDLALLEDSLPEVTASEILAIANAENVRTRLVFFTASGVHGDLAAAIAAGACSEISKYASPETLLQSLRLAAEGISLLPEPSPDLVPTGKEVSGANIGNVLAGLTDREREVMRLVSEGLSNKEVARVLNISQGTIKVHLHNIFQKLEINNRTVLAAIALSQRHGGIGMLSLTALIFSMIEQVRAADPDVTILDNDSIAYKDLEHGVFELVTKEAVPRHILVEDPAETIVLGPRGSTISVIGNSAARMEELRGAQQEVLANFAKGLGPGGSGTPPPYFNSVPVQRINFIQTDATTEQNSLPPLPTITAPVQEFIFVPPPPPPPEPPTLNAAAGPTEIDTVAFDDFSATSGTFTASSSNSTTLTFGISGGTAGSTILDGVTYDVSKTGPYGTLYVSSTTGAYTFVPHSDAINALKANTTESFTITVSDGTLSASQTFTVAIHGANDTAIISGTTTGSVIEIRGVADATPGTQTATGTLIDTDVDDPANTFTAVSSPTKSTSGYGTFTMTAAGVWTYTLDNNNFDVQTLNVGGTLTDTFPVTSIDGTLQVVTITIHGPLIAAMGTAPSLTLSETHLPATPLDDNIAGSAPGATLTTTSGNFSTAFISVQGVDGATISYALSITGGNGTASGLLDSHTGQADVLVLNGNTIEGHVGTTGGTLAFTITVDPTGLVTFTEYRAVTQPFGANPDGGEGVSLTAGIVNLTATITDKDGVFQTASRDLGSRLTITDDGPMIAATGTAPSLTLSETHLTATPLDDNIAGSAPDATLTMTSGNFSTAFTSVQGADGATISYALSIAGGNGTASGLLDSHTGQADVLVLNGNTIEGHVGTTGGTLAFTITLDPTTGRVTFTEYRAVTQASNPDGGEGASLTAGVVNLTATITDKDGDFQTASIDLGSRLTISDDGPMIGGFSHGTIVAQEGQVASGTFNVSFGADGDGAMRVAVHNGAVNGYNLATTDLGGGITSVHVTGNGDDYTFYYTTQPVSGGIKLNAFFTDASGTLSDPFFTLLIKPDGTYTFDIEGVGFLQQTTVSGSDFGASSSGQSSLTAPDGLLVITGDSNGAPADVKASNNGIAVGDTGLQMDQHETLLLTFTPEQTDVSFNLTQWQGNGTADVVFKVYDGATDIHDFNINIPKPSGDAHIVVEKTSNLALVNTYTFDSATSTYTLYVGSDFNQIAVSYDHAVTGNTTFTVNNITYSAGTKIPSTDLLFDVTAVDGDGDTSTTSLQVDLLGVTSVASALTLSGTPQLATITVNGTNDAAIISGATTGSVIEAGDAANATPGTASGTLTDTDVDNPSYTFTAVSSPRTSAGGYRSFAMTAAGVWTYTLDNANSAVQAIDSFTVTTIDGTAKPVTITINGASDADPNDFVSLAAGPEVISDPPYVFGTPGGQTIAGGGNDGQIIYAGAGNDAVNGTGRDDLIYAGSGDDTVKGNDGDDTIYGGSGSDTINGNGSDTIVGGFGADKFTGSNGNDRFVHLSGADSNANLFDVISDFASGSDKINLAALGALAFLALTSTSTSVPPHTIAWIYDSATNETIVYVNPTDQTLRIGSSSLLEIHLQGVVSVDSSDFVFVAAAAPAALAGDPIDLLLAAAADTDGAVFAMTAADGTVDHDDAAAQVTDASFRFDTDRDRFDFGHARFVKFSEARTQPTEETDDNAVTTPDGQLIVPHQVHVADKLGSDPPPVVNSASAMTAHDDAVHASGNIHSADIAAPAAPGDMADLQHSAHGADPGDGGGNPRSHGHQNTGTSSSVTPDGLVVPDVSGNYGLTVASPAAHSGGPSAHGGNPSIPGDVSPHGNASALDPPGPSSTANGVGPGGAGPPGHADSFPFKHDVVVSGNSGAIDLADVGHTPASQHAHAAGNGGPAPTIDLSPPGHSGDDLPSHAGHTHVAHHPHDIMV